MEITIATWRFAAIRALLTIGAFEELAAGPLTIGELAGRCGADAAILKRVLRCVAATGLLRSAGPYRCELTDACRAAMDGWAFAGLRVNSDAEFTSALDELTETIRIGNPPLMARHGSLFDYLATHPVTAAAFDALMEGLSPPSPVRWRGPWTSPS
jgi:hypothetical protein